MVSDARGVRRVASRDAGERLRESPPPSVDQPQLRLPALGTGGHRRQERPAEAGGRLRTHQEPRLRSAVHGAASPADEERAGRGHLRAGGRDATAQYPVCVWFCASFIHFPTSLRPTCDTRRTIRPRCRWSPARSSTCRRSRCIPWSRCSPSTRSLPRSPFLPWGWRSSLTPRPRRLSRSRRSPAETQPRKESRRTS